MEDATSPATTNSTRSSGRTLANLSPTGQGGSSNNSSSSTITETSPLKKDATAICEAPAGSAARGCSDSRRPTLTADDVEAPTKPEEDAVGQKVEQILFRAKQQLQVRFVCLLFVFRGGRRVCKKWGGWLPLSSTCMMHNRRGEAGCAVCGSQPYYWFKVFLVSHSVRHYTLLLLPLLSSLVHTVLWD